MSYFRESIEACDALLEKHGNIARRAKCLFPEERRKLERAGRINPPPGFSGVVIAGMVDFAKVSAFLATKSVRRPTANIGKGRGRWRATNPALIAAAGEYERLAPAVRYGQQQPIAKKHGVNQGTLSAYLKKRRIDRALAENAVHPKAA